MIDDSTGHKIVVEQVWEYPDMNMDMVSFRIGFGEEYFVQPPSEPSNLAVTATPTYISAGDEVTLGFSVLESEGAQFKVMKQDGTVLQEYNTATSFAYTPSIAPETTVLTLKVQARIGDDGLETRPISVTIRVGADETGVVDIYKSLVEDDSVDNPVDTAVQAFKGLKKDYRSNRRVKRAIGWTRGGMQVARSIDAYDELDSDDKTSLKKSFMSFMARNRLAESRIRPSKQDVFAIFDGVTDGKIEEADFEENDVVLGLTNDDVSNNPVSLVSRTITGSGWNENENSKQAMVCTAFKGKERVIACDLIDDQGNEVQGYQTDPSNWVLHLLHMSNVYGSIKMLDADGNVIPPVEGDRVNYEIYRQRPDVVTWGAEVDHTNVGEDVNMVVLQRSFTTINVTDGNDWVVTGAVEGTTIRVDYGAVPGSYTNVQFQYKVGGVDSDFVNLGGLISGGAVEGNVSLDMTTRGDLAGSTQYTVTFQVVITDADLNDTAIPLAESVSFTAEGGDPEDPVDPEDPTDPVDPEDPVNGGAGVGSASGDPYILPMLT